MGATLDCAGAVRLPWDIVVGVLCPTLIARGAVRLTWGCAVGVLWVSPLVARGAVGVLSTWKRTKPKDESMQKD